jgi:ABC-type uncharacterized transport system involved in gliding motility auxiliary subunit
VKLLADWGVTANNDLALDLSGLGRFLDLGPDVAILAAYENQPIVRDFKELLPAIRCPAPSRLLARRRQPSTSY